MKRQSLLAAGATGLLAMAGLAVIHANAEEASGCSVTYRVQAEWSGGFLAAIDIAERGPAKTAWTLGFDFPDTGQRVANGWNANWTQSQSHVTVTNLSWNARLATSKPTTVGFVGSRSGKNPVPSTFTLNGITCVGGTTPTPTPTETPTLTPTPSKASAPPPSGTPTPTNTTAPAPTNAAAPASDKRAPALHVSGNKLLAADGRTYRMLGVNRASAEFACVQGKGIWDSEQPDQASVDAMKSWKIHAVRIPLNEECWLGTNGTPNGATYQNAVKEYVQLLESNGITPIVEMHWNYGQYSGNGAGCSDAAATCQKPMPDAQYAPKFWTSVATMFKGDSAVVFDLFNEPYPDAAANWKATEAWTCWRDGGTCTGISYQVAGMQTLIDTVRATGAKNVIMLNGLTWSNDLSQWLTYKPKDSTGNLMASWHTYNFNSCSDASCWDSQIATVAAKVPVHAGEIGQNSCAHDYIDKVMDWLDGHGIGYTAWTWNPWGCSSGNVLITNYDGTPTSTYGEGFKAHLAAENPYTP